MKHSLLLLTLIPFCLSATNPEVKEAVESVTYSTYSRNSNDMLSHTAEIALEKEETPNSISYTQKINAQEVKILGHIFYSHKGYDGSYVSYKKDKQTKEIIVSIDYGAPGSLSTEFFLDMNDREKVKGERFELLKALFKAYSILEKHKSLKNMNPLPKVRSCLHKNLTR